MNSKLGRSPNTDGLAASLILDVDNTVVRYWFRKDKWALIEKVMFKPPSGPEHMWGDGEIGFIDSTSTLLEVLQKLTPTDSPTPTLDDWVHSVLFKLYIFNASSYNNVPLT